MNLFLLVKIWSKDYLINIRIINVESAELISAEMEKCYAEKDLINSIQKLVQTVTDKTIEKYSEEKATPIAVLDLQIN
ncbi:MAG: hypothetical protein AABY84_03850 [Candidatus Firestonebacteria bacterium]